MRGGSVLFVVKSLIKKDSKIYGGTLVRGRWASRNRWKQRSANCYLKGRDRADRTAEAARQNKCRAWRKQEREEAGEDVAIDAENRKEFDAMEKHER